MTKITKKELTRRLSIIGYNITSTNEWMANVPMYKLFGFDSAKECVKATINKRKSFIS